MGVNTKSFDNASDMITFSRASGAYGFTKVGYGSELVSNGGFDSDSDWTLGTDWSISGGAAISNNTSGYNPIYQALGVSAGKRYLVLVEVSDYTSGQLTAYLGNSGNGSALIYLEGPSSSFGSVSGIGVYTAFITAPDGQLPQILLRSNGGFIGSITSVSVKEVIYNSSDPSATLKLIYHPNDVPRIEYALDGTAKGLLIEEARTNLLLNNLNLYSARNSVLKGFRVSTASVVPASTQLVVSFYLKPKSVSRKDIAVNTDAYTFPAIPTTGLPQGVWTRVETEAVTGTGGVQSFLDLELLTATAPTYTQNSGIAPDGTLTATEITDGTYTYEIWGAQLEEGSFATSFIKNEGAASTRAVDVASIPVSKFGYNQTEGTLFAEASSYEGSPRLLHLNDGSDSNRAQISASASNVSGYVQATGDSGSFISVAGAPTAPFEVALGIETDNMGLTVGGSSVSTDTSQNMPVSITNLNIGSGAIGGSLGQAHIKSIQYYPRRLTDAQLQELTT